METKCAQNLGYGIVPVKNLEKIDDQIQPESACCVPEPIYQTSISSEDCIAYEEKESDDYGSGSHDPDYPASSSDMENYPKACIAYAGKEPSYHYEDYGSEYESVSMNGHNSKGACIAYAEQAFNAYDGYEDRTDTRNHVFSTEIYEDNIYAYIAEYEEIDDNGSKLEQCYVAVASKNEHRELQRIPMSAASCFAAFLNPHQLLFGWKSKIPWACQTTLRTWSRVLSTKMGSQFSVATSGTTATVTFLRRTMRNYNTRPSDAIQDHEQIPGDFLHKIQTIFDMAKYKPTRYKHIIGISCFPIHMSMPRSLWKDLSILNSIITQHSKSEKRNSTFFVTTDAAADRLGQIQQVITSYYGRRYGIEEIALRAYIADTGPNFRNMHSSMFAMRALSALAKRGQSILLPEPCHPTLNVWFNVFQSTTGVRPRYYRRDPKRDWMLDFGDLQRNIDHTTAAIFMSNPSVISGGISSSRELDIMISLLAKRRIPLIMEETMDYLVYDPQQPSRSVLELKPLIPVIVINSSYRWMIFGSQGPCIAWSLVYDPESLLPQSLYESLRSVQDQSLKQSTGLPSPRMLSSILHCECWANDIVRYMAKNMAIACSALSHTPGVYFAPPKSGYFLIIMIDFQYAFAGTFSSDADFSSALFNEESVKVVTGSVLLGWKDSFALEMYMRRDLLIEACDRIDDFCRRHAKKVPE